MRVIKNFRAPNFIEKYGIDGKRILNAGSASVRYGENCVNVDIKDGPGVDVVCDIHDIPDSLGMFDVVICNAVLQYCRNPQTVIDEFYRVLRTGGYLYLDVPWVQPACQDPSDLYRFSDRGLRHLLSRFEIVELGPSIRPGSSFYMLGAYIADSMTKNARVNLLLRAVAGVVLFPFKWIKTSDECMSAGAFYAVCRKP